MVQRIITLCSVHYRDGEGEEVEATNFEPVLLPGWRAPRFIDLCETCEKELIEPLRNAVDEYGDKVDRTPPPVGTLRDNRRGKTAQNPPTSTKRTSKAAYAEGVACPLASQCRQHDRIFTTRGVLRDHMKASHNRELAEYEAEIGTSAEGFEITHMCDVKGCKHGYATAQGLSNHLRIDHHQ